MNKDILSKKICILGLGYIGLPTACMFATHGFKVIGMDVSKTVVDSLCNGNLHIEEPFLDILFHAAMTSEKLTVSNHIEKADVFIISVPTPYLQNKTADLSMLENAAESIVPCLEKGNIVVLESTVPAGTTEDVLSPILEKSGLQIGTDVLIAHCPERVLPGKILVELVENNRIIGGINKKSAMAVKELYQTFVKGEIICTDSRTAELAKLVENTYRDVNIAFANELAKICNQMDINVNELIKIANKHPRVNILNPGPGVGGHCLAIDPWFIVQKTPELAKIISAARITNESMPEYVVNKVKSIVGEIEEPKITVLGVAYKADVDDTRESPSNYIIAGLENLGYKVAVFDSHVQHYSYELFDFDQAIDSSSLLLIVTDHSDFKKINPDLISNQVRNKNIFDTRNCLDREKWIKAGFSYYAL